jgi:hypothetical protein
MCNIAGRAQCLISGRELSKRKRKLCGGKGLRPAEEEL